MTIEAKNEYVIEGDVVRVKLTRGRWMLCDLADLPKLAGYRWHAAARPSGRAYAANTNNRPGALSTTYAHNVLMPSPPAGMTPDHIDMDGLNNRAGNLRYATHSQQKGNSLGWSKSGFKGVSRNGIHGFQARIRINGKQAGLGTFKTAEEAARCYDRAALATWGDFARINFPPSDYALPALLPSVLPCSHEKEEEEEERIFSEQTVLPFAS